jgi:hypothetical protein
MTLSNVILKGSLNRKARIVDYQAATPRKQADRDDIPVCAYRDTVKVTDDGYSASIKMCFLTAERLSDAVYPTYSTGD